ncbi:ABC transporter ATP-binding protein [Pseudomonas sp. TKO26]|uniref:ABC transporter ATP-binding protein n=1 Tax=unclassified Pseudomonas TaxID=196821 RepID=UPI000D83A3A4|nr:MULTISPECIES: ABC transporter ATP-binding protein [unclassified Pseudomonas]PYY88485.1 ABC transporter ATP-binding protein [Pseudomonas sp. TKO30]PYY91345.1 ABC transporter ATP-binding protein [Pseudomonas sp. TKO29]PYY94000.1 ABC transporter ATP-binding protein [Pseudomonas sp. TKO26]PYZ00714.1 ABC transporter ATP-binding protein [Pseudomonas sp. TKO14]
MAVVEHPGLTALLRPVRGRLLAAMLLQVLAALVGLLPLIAVAELAPLLLAGQMDLERAGFWLLAGAGALLLRLLGLAAGLQITHLADSDLQRHLRQRIAAHLARVPLAWLEGQRHTAERVLLEDVGALHQLVAHLPNNLVAALVVPLASLIYLLTVSLPMTLVVLAPPLIALWRLRVMGTPAYRAERQRLGGAMGALSTATLNFVQSIAMVKSFGRVQRVQDEFFKAVEDFAAFFSSWVERWAGLGASVEVLLSPLLVLALVLLAGVPLVAVGVLQPLQLLPFALLGPALAAPVAALGHGADSLVQGRAAAQRISALLGTPLLAQPVCSREPDGAVVNFESVDFSYPDGSQVLHGIDLCLQPGTLTALVGDSGAGKSTLATLLARFADVSAGAIRIGGVDLREMDSATLYRQVAFVFQEVRLLRASVLDNLRLSRPGASLAEVEAAARAAQIHDRICALPQGYHSQLEEGLALSGGEIQRLGIARAMLSRAPILVLDEATAASDPQSEAAIQQALSRLAQGRTVLVVAHRLSSIQDAEQIAVLQGGRLVECGQHQALLERQGVYAGLWAAEQLDAAALNGSRP